MLGGLIQPIKTHVLFEIFIAGHCIVRTIKCLLSPLNWVARYLMHSGGGVQQNCNLSLTIYMIYLLVMF